MSEKAKIQAKLNRIIASAELSSIRLVSISALSDPPKHVTSTGEIDMAIKSYLHRLEEKKGKKIAMFARCAISLESREDRAFSFSAELELFYELAKLEAEEEDFGPFVEHNVPFNAWPFLRELVQNASSRMNIPPVTLPLMKR